jgi:hypothetical protein
MKTYPVHVSERDPAVDYQGHIFGEPVTATVQIGRKTFIFTEKKVFVFTRRFVLRSFLKWCWNRIVKEYQADWSA